MVDYYDEAVKAARGLLVGAALAAVFWFVLIAAVVLVIVL
jgi:hypothetical protein